MDKNQDVFLLKQEWKPPFRILKDRLTKGLTIYNACHTNDGSSFYRQDFERIIEIL